MPTKARKTATKPTAKKKAKSKAAPKRGHTDLALRAFAAVQQAVGGPR